MKLHFITIVVLLTPTIFGCATESKYPDSVKYIPNSHAIEYKGCDFNNKPNHVIQLILQYPTTSMNVITTIFEYDDATPGKTTPVTATSKFEHFRTPMNVDLNLGKTSGKRERVYIEVILENNTAWKFNSIDIDGDKIEYDLAITSVSEKKNRMFCRYKGDSSEYKARFVTYLDTKKEEGVFGNYNINIYLIPDINNKDIIIPITIDPEVKNNG